MEIYLDYQQTICMEIERPELRSIGKEEIRLVKIVSGEKSGKISAPNEACDFQSV